MKKILTAMLLTTACNYVMASPTMVVAHRGDVRAVTDGSERRIVQGDELAVNDTIKTGNKSFAVLQFDDGGTITLRPNSTIVIDQYSYGQGDDRASIDLVQGGLRIITGAIAKSDPDNYTLSTPTALMGVRGTEFSVQICDKSCAAK